MTEDLGLLRREFRDIPACRVATVRPDGGPHVATRWFVWPDESLWVATRVGDATWSNASRDPRVSIVVDRGRDWAELAGVRVEGVAELLPAEHPDMRATMSAWFEKYRSALGGSGFERFAEAVPRLGFVRVSPARVDTWRHT